MLPAPGPWKLVDTTLRLWNGEDLDYIQVDDSHNDVVAYLPDDRSRSNDFHKQQTANAYLIAAAPELLEALQWVERLLGPLPPDSVVCDVEHPISWEFNTPVHRELRKVFAVITKALEGNK